MIDKEKNVQISVVIDRDTYNKIVEDANYEDRSVSNMAAVIIRRYYKAKAKKLKEY